MNDEDPISVNCKKAEQLVVVTTWLGQMIPCGFGVHVSLRSHILSPTTRVFFEIHCLTAKATLQSFSDPNAPRVCPPALLDGQAAILPLLYKLFNLIPLNSLVIKPIVCSPSDSDDSIDNVE